MPAIPRARHRRGGKQSLPDDVRVELELLAERRFGSGMMYLRYRVKT
jgi:hypothetical protein